VADMTIGIIGGSGLGEALAARGTAEPVEMDTPFGSPSGPVLRTRWEDVELAMLARHGEGHRLNPSTVPYRANIYALKSLGVTHIIASGAVGSLRDRIRPRDLVIPDQVIDKTFRRDSTFFDAGLVAHVEFADPFCPVLRQILIDAATDVEATVHNGGTYVCMEGPQFSSRAESHMHRQWGGDLIGMTCMPEAKLAREAEICYALVALVTDYDCWRPHQHGLTTETLLVEIVGHLQSATENAIALIRATIENMSAAPPGRSPIHDALKLAIWSDKNKVDPAVVNMLKPILGKYF
jgi:5'-methylthioadenosine phosphorylase